MYDDGGHTVDWHSFTRQHCRYLVAIVLAETLNDESSECDAVVQWMMATYFELTSLACVKFPPHKPCIVTKYECAPLHSYDFFHKHIRHIVPSPVVTALCKTSTFAPLTSFTMLDIYRIPSPLSMHFTQFTKQTHVSEKRWRHYRACVEEIWHEQTMSDVNLKYIVIRVTFTRSSLSSLLAFQPYILHLFTCLLSSVHKFHCKRTHH